MAGIAVEQAEGCNNVSGLLRHEPKTQVDRAAHSPAPETQPNYHPIEKEGSYDDNEDVKLFVPTPNPVCNVEFSEEDISDILHASTAKPPLQEEISVMPIPIINEPLLEESLPLSQSSNLDLSEIADELSNKDDSSLCLSPISLANEGRRRSSTPQLSFIQASDIVTMTRPELVAKEIILTEKAYVNDLQSIIEGYLYHVFRHGPPGVDIEKIFSNLEEIYDFNRTLFEQLEQYAYIPEKVAECFVEKAKGFNTLYAQYCTSYPEANAFLSEVIFDNKEAAAFFQDRQKALGHALPLETYLLKPVQRITKYHLLFQDILKHTDKSKEGYAIIKAAAEDMTDVADYINEVKRLQEDIVKTHDALEAMVGIDSLDVYKTGRLVLENTFRVQGYRGERHLFLFEKLLLICKRIDEHFFQFKNGILCSNMMLVESTGKDLTCFRIIRFDNQKIIYNIQARSADIKWLWVQHLKRLLLENHPALVPVTAKEAILGSNTNKLNRNSKFNSLTLDSNDDLSEKLLRQQKNNRVTSGKENRSSPVISLKRMSSVGNSPEVLSPEKDKKPSLNAKAREFLDRKSKMLQIVTSAVEKNDRSGRPWRFRKSIKQLKTSNSSVPKIPLVSPPPETVSQLNGGIKRDRLPALKKSKSLESLRSVSAAEFDLDMSLPQSLLGNTDHPSTNQAVSDDVVRKQIHRLSMLHELFAIDLSRDTNVNKKTLSIADTEDKSSPMDVDSEINSLASEENNEASVKRKLSRSRPLSLLGDEHALLKKHHSDPTETHLPPSRKQSMELSNQLIHCHSDEIHRRIGSSRETVLIDNEQSDNDNDESIEASKTVQDDIEVGFSTNNKDESIQSDEDGSVIQTTLRKVNEAFSARESNSEEPVDEVAEPSNDTDNNADILLRRRTQSAFACFDSHASGDEEEKTSPGDDSAFIQNNEVDPNPSTTETNESIGLSKHTRSNSEGNVNITNRIDSVQSELDDACEDFSLVVAEMESPHVIPYDTQISRTPVKFAEKVANTNTAIDKNFEGSDKAEAKIVTRRRPSSDRGRSRDFKSVSDRIRAYSHLVDSGSLVNQNINELFESLDTSTEEVSSAYRNQRRRLSRKTPLKRCDSQPTPSEHRNELSKARSRATSDGSSINTSVSFDNNRNEIICCDDRKSMSLPRKFSLNQNFTENESGKGPRKYSLVDSSGSNNGSPLFYDPRFDQSTPIKSSAPTFNNYQTRSNSVDVGTPLSPRRWSQECGSIVSTLRPKQPFQSNNPSVAVNKLYPHTPSFRHIQRSIVHRRVKEYIENVIKPADRMMPSARQRTRFNNRNEIIEEQSTDNEDGSPYIEPTPVEKGTVQRLRGKFAGVET